MPGVPVYVRLNSSPVSTPAVIPNQCDVSVSPLDFPTVYVQNVRPKIRRHQRPVSTTDRELPVCANRNTDVLLHPNIDRHTNSKLHRLTCGTLNVRSIALTPERTFCALQKRGTKSPGSRKSSTDTAGRRAGQHPFCQPRRHCRRRSNQHQTFKVSFGS